MLSPSRSSRWPTTTGRSWPAAASPRGISPRPVGWAIWSTSTRPRCSRSRSIWTNWRRAGPLCPCWTMSPIRAEPGPVNLTSHAPAQWSTAGPASAPQGSRLCNGLIPAGRRSRCRPKPGAYLYPSLSPDGKRVALVFAEGRPDVWVYDPQRDHSTRLTFGGFNAFPKWSPDGQSLVFLSTGNGILQTRADGASQPHALMQSKTLQFPGSFTPDGKRLAYFEAAGNFQIWTVPLENQGGQWKAGKAEPWLKSSFNDSNPVFSPDGRWLAYQSNESGEK